MILVACVDDHMGLLFNHRRQSQDRVLRDRLLALSYGKRLWMNAYSASQFDNAAPQLQVAPDFLGKAAPGDFCFVEDLDPAPYASQAEEILLYRWNRLYPADLFFTLPLPGADWQLRQQLDFPGSSHPKITEEVYCR